MNITINWVDHSIEYTKGGHWSINGKRVLFNDIVCLFTELNESRNDSCDHYILELINIVVDQFSILGVRKLTNAVLRGVDNSKLWPIHSRFNVTDRAIRQCNKFERANGAVYDYEYFMVVTGLITDIVNSEV